MLKKWELSHSPSAKDQNRYKLKLKISEGELTDLLKELKIDTGRSYNSYDGKYDFGLYLYNVDKLRRNELIKILKNRCPTGKIIVGGLELEPQDLDETEEIKPEQQSQVQSQTQPQTPQVPQPTVGGLPPESSPVVPKTIEIEKEKDFWQFKLNPDYTFEEFVIGPNSRFTHAAALAVAENPGKVYNPLFIYGGVGLGKTHLMQAIGHHTLKKKPDMKVFYVTSEKFISEVIDSIGRGEIQKFRDRYRQLDLLLIDDVQFLAESESTQEEFFHTFNILHQAGKQIVLTSDRPPKRLATLEDRLRSRFEWGLIADIKSPSLETRVAILKKKSEHEKINLDNNMLLYVATKLKSNVRELEGFLKRINAYADLTNQPVDMNLVKILMEELLPEEEHKEISAPVSPTPPLQQPSIIPTPIPVAKVTAEKIDTTLKAIEVAFFYPEGKEKELITTKEKFSDITKKHNLKFRLESIFDRSYTPHTKINYSMFTELCKTNKVNIAIVVGPAQGSDVSNDEFMNNLTTLMENENISLQYIPWHELNKDYRYLNLALDITLTKHRIVTT